jgi:hypothetical protein
MLIILHFLVHVYSSRLINLNSVRYLTTPPGMVCPNTHRCSWLFYGIIPHMPIKNYIILFSLHLVVATQLSHCSYAQSTNGSIQEAAPCKMPPEACGGAPPAEAFILVDVASFLKV